MKHLGIDYGLRKIGLALGDSETRVAAPLEVVQNTEDIIDRLKHLIESEDIEVVIVGMPSREQGEITNTFIQSLKEVVEVPIHTVDESYSSVESQRVQEAGSNVPEDALAAMIILEQYFNE